MFCALSVFSNDVLMLKDQTGQFTGPRKAYLFYLKCTFSGKTKVPQE